MLWATHVGVALTTPGHLAPYGNRPRRDSRRGLCGWRARRDSNPQPEVTDQNKRAMAFRSLESRVSAWRGSHGRNQGARTPVQNH